MDDVELMIGLINVVKRELGLERLQATAELLSKESTLSSCLDRHLADDIPDSPGVYLFFGENNLPLYIGKSINIRTRVMSHFSSDYASTKEMRIAQEIKHIEWIATAGDFGALMLESRLVKERQPIYNRQLHHERHLCAWRISETADAQTLLILVHDNDIEPQHLGDLFGIYGTKIQVVEVLRNIVEKFSLCAKAVGLENGKGDCFGYQLKRCKGVCIGVEYKQLHYLRLQQAMAAQRLTTWPHKGRIVIKEQNSAADQTDLHLFDHWCYLRTVSDEAELEDMLNTEAQLRFDLDTYKLLLQQLSNKQLEIIQL